MLDSLQNKFSNYRTSSLRFNIEKNIIITAVALPEYFSAALSLLNLLENSLGRSKPATRLMQAH